MTAIRTESFEDYKRSEGVSNTMLGWLVPPSTPAHFKARWITGEIEDEETPALKLGAITHSAILEPDAPISYHIKPEGMNFATKKGKAWRDKAYLTADVPIITHEENQQICRMIKAVWSHPVSKIIKASRTEVNVYAEDSHGTLRKGRIDILPPSGECLYDIKTCDSVAPDAFSRAIDREGYHRQAAYYLDLLKLAGREFTSFRFICVEKTAPYLVNVMQLDPQAIEAGRREYQCALQLYRNCTESGDWYGYPHNEITPVSLPAWRMKQIEQVQ